MLATTKPSRNVSVRERSAAANRMSHIFGLTGPTSTAETACSKLKSMSMSSRNNFGTRYKQNTNKYKLLYCSFKVDSPKSILFFWLRLLVAGGAWHRPDDNEARATREDQKKILNQIGNISFRLQNEGQKHGILDEVFWAYKKKCWKISKPSIHLVRSKLEDQMNPNIGTDLKHGLVVGCPDFVEMLVMLWSCGLCY